MRFNSSLRGSRLSFLSGDFGRIFGRFSGKLGFGLSYLGDFCRLLGQSRGLKRRGFSGAVGGGLRALAEASAAAAAA